MQYIECIYCGKRYPANQKMRDAMGKKKVRCTNCGQSFPVVVYEVKPSESHDADPEEGHAPT